MKDLGSIMKQAQAMQQKLADAQAKIAEIVVEEMGLKNVNVTIEGKAKAWAGDQPRVHFTVDKTNKLGWKCKRSSDDAVRTAVRRFLGKEQG